MDSTGALEVEEIPDRLLVIGGGIIGLEMATVYDALGSKVTVVELLDQLIPGADKDLVRVLEKRIKGRYEAIHLKTGVSSVEAGPDGLKVTFGEQTSRRSTASWSPSAGARTARSSAPRRRASPSTSAASSPPTGRCAPTSRTSTRSATSAASRCSLTRPPTRASSRPRCIAGHDVTWDVRSIPSVAYTDPEVAWTGLTETQAKADGIEYEVGAFPWAASGRALSVGRSDGLTKLIVEPDTNRVLGAGIVGVNAGELLAEAVLAIESGLDAEDIGLTIHPHPTLSETVGFSAEMAEGTITDIMPKSEASEGLAVLGGGPDHDLVDVDVRRLLDREHDRAGDVVRGQRLLRGRG